MTVGPNDAPGGALLPTFTATMEVDPAPGPAEGLAVRHAGTLGLHPGLRFACIDDSEVACRLLAYSPGRTSESATQQSLFNVCSSALFWASKC